MKTQTESTGPPSHIKPLSQKLRKPQRLSQLRTVSDNTTLLSSFIPVDSVVVPVTPRVENRLGEVEKKDGSARVLAAGCWLLGPNVQAPTSAALVIAFLLERSVHT
ncbi:hypothetical protein D0865_13984 [Hortaea werneckii]|uniref:Uncharacterized protein n=1 Tax=Hortaea werneckii TaxID=91943 RepID=A0A3M7B600_HORWE|nr:hypothetical protein D0865_13984 [Hortaea werneckii]